MVTYRGCICTREFDAAVKRVGEREYVKTGQILQTETERSIRRLNNAILKRKGRSNVK